MRMKLTVNAMAVIAASVVFATDSVVSNSQQVVLTGQNNAITMSTVDIAAFPAELGTPTFWFDASQTNDWTFGANGTIIRVPSLVGDGRYLTSDVTEPGTSWYTWKTGNANQTMVAPTLATGIAALGGGNAIDFGAQASGRGLLFNAIETADGTVKNILTNIGTVVMVLDSTDGGGFILGGGTTKNIDWGRGYNMILPASSKGTVYYSNYLTGGEATGNAKGMYWQDDLYGAAPCGGLGGGWQAIAYNPKVVMGGATGIGIGATIEWYKSYSGGMKIAEMMIFDKLIADDDLHKLTVWMQRKWFGRSPAGYNSRAQASSVCAQWVASGAKNASVDVTCNAGETLEVGEFRGGRAGESAAPAELRKFGAGTLKVRDIRDYNGNVTLAGGTFMVEPKRTIPTVATLPRGLRLRLDASDDDSRIDVVENGKEVVSAIGNLSSMTLYGERVWARSPDLSATGNKPTLLRNVLGEGLHAFDFGTNVANGIHYVFATNSTLGTTFGLGGICTMMAVVGAQQAGGHVLNGMMFKRQYQYVRQYDQGCKSPLLNPDAVWFGDSPKAVSPRKYGVLYLDGVKRAADSGYPVPTWYVVAIQVPSCNVDGIAKYGSTAWAGGLKLGEMLLFNRPLSETELMDTQAYLMKKWFGRTLGGYQEETTVPDVQNLVVTSPSTIEVADGDVVRVAKVTATAKLTKTGGGTLVVGAESDTANVEIQEGAVQKEANPPDVSELCELAEGDALHLDANATNRIDLLPGYESENRMTCWNDLKMRNRAHQFAVSSGTENLNKHPTLAVAAFNGKNVVDFGPYGASSASGFLTLEKAVDSVRSVYLVIGSAGNGGNPLGTFQKDGDATTYWGNGDFSRTRFDSAITADTPWFSAANANVKSGTLYINGVEKPMAATPPSGGYELVEVHLPAAATFSELGRSCGWYSYGGFTLGELVAYSRPLTEREKIATRNYLLKKWFNKSDGELTPLPDVPPAPAALPCEVGKVVIGANHSTLSYSGMDVTIAETVEVEIRELPAENVPVRVFSASSISEKSRLKGAVYSGVLVPQGMHIKFAVENGWLTACLERVPGILIIVH